MTAIDAEQLSDHALPSLREHVRGRVTTPGEDGYDTARAAWNLNADHRPAVVVQAEGRYDIQAAVRWARTAGLGVGVMATGHGTGVPCDGGVLVNTAGMAAVEIHPEARVARVAAGARWQDVITAAGAHGLVGLPGSSPGVGVVGSTLGGSFGWLGRRFGLAAHSVTRAEVVTADGDLVTATADEHPDLFWGLQGGTGNLGIVASLEFALHPVRTVYAGNLYYPLERAADLLAFFAEWSRTVPDELTAAATFRSFPPVPAVPEPLRGTSWVALRGCFCGEPAAGRQLIDRARAALGPAAIDTFTEMPAADLAEVSMDPVTPLPALSHSELLRDLRPETIEALVSLAGPGSGSPLVMVELRQLGGALSGPAGALSPMAHTAAAFSLNAIGITPGPDSASAVRTHLQRLATAVRGSATGETYLNFLELDGATPERVRAAYSATDWDRLRQVKAAYDPHDVFRFNRNIPLPPERSGSAGHPSTAPNSQPNSEPNSRTYGKDA